MTKIQFSGVDLAFPIFNATGRSLTSKFLNVLSSGKLDKDASGHITVNALANINLNFTDGDRVGILGGNGAGKSTMLRLMSKIYSPTQGKIEVVGSIGTLIDISLGINPEATGRENIFTRGRLLGMSKEFIRENFDEIVEFSELGQFIDLPVRTYSSGMLMRLGFSISTVLRPDILLMDEWLAVGDEKFRAKAEVRLLQLFESSRILVLATHSRDLVLKMCNKALLLEGGTIRSEGTVEQVCRDYFG